ncbi:hypothetical protein [Thioalbus denitrificans]|uniref:Uncharacterized protein n=1 Tax=Thioalbus denitrificans TaxID=547122 RepID=A0A369CES2_9GAMM|nr:hypothetical protein [Thioalbus denitrificans]RCX32071.1 hypothetical protein DFQ59_102424 [Thioalbus denitrificans]
MTTKKTKPEADAEAATPEAKTAEAAAAESTPPEPAAGADAVAESPKAKAAEIPDWKRADYTGPLDCAQADWRNRHLTK